MMIRSTNIADIDDALRALRNACVSLTSTADRPIARRNARKKVLGTLRKIRAVVDEQFPAIVNRSAPRLRRTPKEREKALERAGWVRTSMAGHFAAAGVPVKRVAWKEVVVSTSPATYVKRKGWVSGATSHTVKHESLFIPRWAKVIGPHKPTELRAVKKSRTLQKATLVTEALRS